jgi:osmotically-inducible protein OsmY
MEVHSRVYSRLHWDKVLNGSRIEVHMLRDGTALLQGNVSDAAARKRAVDITRDTVGVNAVIDNLNPLAAPTTTTTTTTTTVSPSSDPQ